MYNMNNRIDKAMDKMTDNEKYKLMELLEKEDYTFLEDDRIDYYNNGECCVVEVLVNAIIECGKTIFKLFK